MHKAHDSWTRAGLLPTGLDEDARHLEELAARGGVGSLDIAGTPDEARLDEAALELRKRWLTTAHRPADRTMKSPCEGTMAGMPGGGRVSFGYERDLDVSLLELRGPVDHASPPGWRSTRILCRSGQAALACLLHLVIPPEEATGILRIHHAGRYFETRALLELWPKQVLQPSPATEPTVDLLVGEPTYCDGQFGAAEPTELPRVQRALLLDTTLSGPRVELEPWFAQVDGPLVAVFRSGLKLDQAGLELANVGIIQLFVRDGDDRKDVGTLADALRRVRALTGSGLTLDEMAALSAPWFLDAASLRHYTDAVFANNEVLGRTIGSQSPVFEPRCHPVLQSDRAAAPFCALQLRGGDLAAHRRLLATIEQEVERRGLLVAKGGSFGFRGPRYELVEPAPGEGTPFVRVAMGFRGGPSSEGLIELLRELAKG